MDDLTAAEWSRTAWNGMVSAYVRAMGFMAPSPENLDRQEQFVAMRNSLAEDVERLFRTQPAHPDGAVGEWRPISTAPKDGTKVLVYRAGISETAWWKESANGHPTGFGGDGWWYPIWSAPTHWLPAIPDPEPPPRPECHHVTNHKTQRRNVMLFQPYQVSSTEDDPPSAELAHPDGTGELTFIGHEANELKEGGVYAVVNYYCQHCDGKGSIAIPNYMSEPTYTNCNWCGGQGHV